MTANPLAPEWLAEPADANELASTVWPRHAARDADGMLTLAGVRADALVAEFGSPVYVVDEADVRARAAGIREVFAEALRPLGASITAYYAGKAFLCAAVAQWVTEAGLGVDVASGGELALALAAGVEPNRIGVHGNNKSDAELEAAVLAGVGSIVLDSADEVATRAGRVQNVRLRINSGVHASTHEYLATAREDQKFGVAIAQAPAIVAAIRAQPSLTFLGLHSHIGSQIFASEGFAEAARRLMTLHAELLSDGPVPQLNLGGGFGIAYRDTDTPADLADLAGQIADGLAAAAAAAGIPVPDIAIEPGRSVVAPSTVTLYTVGTIKPITVTGDNGASAERVYVSVDGGMSDNLRPALYRADYTARIASRTSDAAPALVRVAGKHCESGDIVVHAEYLPGDIRRGDLLAVAATGAYGWSMSSNYNWLTRPPVVAVRDGHARVIVRGERIEDLLARDALLPEPLKEGPL